MRKRQVRRSWPRRVKNSLRLRRAMRVRGAGRKVVRRESAMGGTVGRRVIAATVVLIAVRREGVVRKAAAVPSAGDLMATGQRRAVLMAEGPMGTSGMMTNGMVIVDGAMVIAKGASAIVARRGASRAIVRTGCDLVRGIGAMDRRDLACGSRGGLAWSVVPAWRAAPAVVRRAVRRGVNGMIRTWAVREEGLELHRGAVGRAGRAANFAADLAGRR